MASPRRPSPARPNAHARRPDGIQANITALRPASGRERAELIRDVIDAFRRLRESLYRLRCLLAPETACAEAAASASLQPLLTALAPLAERAGLTRPREFKRAIRAARLLDGTRDALFSDTFCRDPEAMRRTLAELERLDAAFVGFGIEYVLARHEPATSGTRSVERARRPRAIARPVALAPEPASHAAPLIGKLVGEAAA